MYDGLLNFNVFNLYFKFFNLGGFLGYIQFFEETKDNILLNYPEGDILLTLAKIGFFFVMIFSYPLFIHVCNEGSEKVFFQNWSYSYPRWLIQSFLYVASSYILAIAVPSITTVFGLTGFYFL